uniref:leucine-rich repeat receptor protein kinase EMS1-like n=1 Tax=Erigeron canadensis TaxID=72917 RepID=UPI001CB92D0F|nr:leucine-rich repeat receptor protein kinase EMS1-like [Erigeron canadensis]
MARAPFQGGNLQHIKIPLSAIVAATENFAKEYEIASGGFGTVYKAKLAQFDKGNLRLTEGKNESELQKECITVAIKRIMVREDKLGEESFYAEIKMLCNCDHPNIVSLLGFCDEGQELILVYELASNRSLEDFLQNHDSLIFSLNWEQRIKICIGIARGLHYLHTERGIVHRDIKSANILLNQNWDAKIADFGLSRSHATDQQANTIQTKRLAGTPYYIDPEYESTGTLRKSSDIYSLGVVLFEIMCGKLAYHHSFINENRKGLPAIARQRFEDGTIKKLVDPVLFKEEYLNQHSLDTFSEVAYNCLDGSQANRPNGKDIIEKLQKALSFQKPRKKKEGTLRIPFDEILLATKKFSMQIGKGGFGEVYRGELTHANEHKTIAAKRRNWKNAKGAKEFAAECMVLSKYKHENVIVLVGYCKEPSEMVIVYEYASKSSLDRHLGSSDLSWTKRLNICIDVARGIDFLQKGIGTLEILIHRDIKSGSILLNDDWKAKISNFGSSLRIPKNQQRDYVIDEVVGTRGYIDPVYQRRTFLTKESDMYSLGVVLLEVLCGRLSIEYDDEGECRSSLLELVNQHFSEKGTLDEIVLECIKEQIVPGSLAVYSRIAFQCLDPERENRPTASQVIEQLTQALEFQVSFLHPYMCIYALKYVITNYE